MFRFSTFSVRNSLQRLSGFAVVVFFCLLPSASNAADEEQFWTSGQIVKLLPESPWRLGVEGVYRHSTTGNRAIVQSIRTSLGYKIESGTVFQFIHESQQASSDKNNETRLVAQVSRRTEFENFILALRFRQEFRLFEDSKAWMNRSRGQVRLALEALQFGIVTPFVSSEFLYIWNTVEARDAGTIELRTPVGLTFEVLAKLNLDLAYMDRRIFSNSNETRIAVAFSSLTYEF